MMTHQANWNCLSFSRKLNSFLNCQPLTGAKDHLFGQPVVKYKYIFNFIAANEDQSALKY